jgi:hypothetical protein
VEITTTYSYLGVQFIGRRFKLRLASQLGLARALEYAPICVLERQFFLVLFLDIPFVRIQMLKISQ